MTTIAVYTSAGYVRHVTENQDAAEVAGKVLPQSDTLWRTARKQSDGWFCYYFLPSEEQVKAWENRSKAGGRDGADHVLGQERFAH